ncbi:MAG TPA: class I SAM-dependent methyltransferase [Bacteroidales bacterium]|nr:class I SAM-dependent methyltransferase [Bacteroidales bacterium]
MWLRRNRIRLSDYRNLVTESPVPCMVSPYERAFLEYYARDMYKGVGEIVDLGVWFGASTYALAKGLETNRNVKQKVSRIHAYDLFFWEESLNTHVAVTQYENMFQPGDSYAHVFDSYLTNYRDYVVRKGDIVQEKWNEKPIEFLFIDAMKNMNTTRHILQYFYPCLIPGKSYVVYQDFDHYLTPWIHILIYRFREYLIPIHDIFPTGGFVFQLQKAIPTNRLLVDFLDIPISEIDEAFRYCLLLAQETKRPNIMAAHVMVYYFLNRQDEATRLYNSYAANTIVQKNELVEVEKLLKNA